MLKREQQRQPIINAENLNEIVSNTVKYLPVILSETYLCSQKKPNQKAILTPGVKLLFTQKITSPQVSLKISSLQPAEVMRQKVTQVSK